MICPRCDGQGSVMEVRIKRTNETIFACDECEASWNARGAIGAEEWEDFGTRLKSMGLSPTWAEVEVLREA